MVLQWKGHANTLQKHGNALHGMCLTSRSLKQVKCNMTRKNHHGTDPARGDVLHAVAILFLPPLVLSLLVVVSTRSDGALTPQLLWHRQIKGERDH